MNVFRKTFEIIFILLVTGFLFSCEKDEDLSKLNGEWKLLSSEASYSNDHYYFTEGQGRLKQYFYEDTLEYEFKVIEGIDYTTYKEKCLYSLELEIDNETNVLVKCNLTDLETGVEKDTTFYTSIVKGKYDYLEFEGEIFDLKIEFGENNFYIAGYGQEPINNENSLFIKIDEIRDDKITLRCSSNNSMLFYRAYDFEYVFEKI
jgi:hypothetical protein